MSVCLCVCVCVCIESDTTNTKKVSTIRLLTHPVLKGNNFYFSNKCFYFALYGENFKTVLPPRYLVMMCKYFSLKTREISHYQQYCQVNTHLLQGSKTRDDPWKLSICGQEKKGYSYGNYELQFLFLYICVDTTFQFQLHT